jgi:hypothetical protein
MKNSTKYLLAALLVLLASLTAYNMALRTEYRAGTYKDPLRNFTALKFTGFDEIAVPAASTITVKIVAGPYAVHLSPDAAEYVHLRQQGRQLLVEASFPSHHEYLGNRPLLVISCPRLTTLRTDAVYQQAGQPQVDKEYALGHSVQVQGFRQDSLVVRADHASRVELAGNKLGLLRAETGLSPGSHTALQVGADNHIAAASFRINHQAENALDARGLQGIDNDVGNRFFGHKTGAGLPDGKRVALSSTAARAFTFTSGCCPARPR